MNGLGSETDNAKAIREVGAHGTRVAFDGANMLRHNQIAEMTYLSVNTVKSYLRSLYRKIGVTTRTEAALWGVDHGFSLDAHRIDDWA